MLVFEHYFKGKRKGKLKKKVVTHLCLFSGKDMTLPGSGEVPKAWSILGIRWKGNTLGRDCSQCPG